MDENNLKATWAPGLEETTFQANGTKYTISKRLSIERLALHQRFEIEFGFNTSFLGLVEALKAIYLHLNSRNFADAAVCTHNAMYGIAKTEENELQSIRLCSLFMNYEGEDTSTYNEDIYAKKAEDWKRANIDGLYFFQRAALSSNGYINAYKEAIQGTLLSQPEIEE